MKTYKELVGDRIREVREARGLSQDALAEALTKSLGSDVDQSRISRWEGGKNLPTGRRRQFLLKHLDVAERDIFGMDLTHPPNPPIGDIEGLVGVYDLKAASSAIKDALDMLAKFANLPPKQQKIALSVIYQDPAYFRGATWDDVPEWLIPKQKVKHK